MILGTEHKDDKKVKMISRKSVLQNKIFNKKWDHLCDKKTSKKKKHHFLGEKDKNLMVSRQVTTSTSPENHPSNTPQCNRKHTKQPRTSIEDRAKPTKTQITTNDGPDSRFKAQAAGCTLNLKFGLLPWVWPPPEPQRPLPSHLLCLSKTITTTQNGCSTNEKEALIRFC